MRQLPHGSPVPRQPLADFPEDMKPALRLQWEKGVSGDWFALTSEVGGWTLVVSDQSIGVACGNEVLVSRLRTKRDRYEAMVEAEEVARAQLAQRFGPLL
jgi:hypothetical protein